MFDGSATLFQVYEHVINADKLRARITEGEQCFSVRPRRIVVDKREHLFTSVLSTWRWDDDADGGETWTGWAADLEDVLPAAKIQCRVVDAPSTPGYADTAARTEAVKRWFEDHWMRIGPTLRLVSDLRRARERRGGGDGCAPRRA